MTNLSKRFFLWYHAVIATIQALTFMRWQLICRQSMRNYLPTYKTKDKIIFSKHPLSTEINDIWDEKSRRFFSNAAWDTENRTFISSQEATIQDIKRHKR